MVLAMASELRGVDYKATGTLQRSVDAAGRMSRDAFEGLLDAMVRAGLIGIEDAEYEKDGEVRRFRKVRLTEAGLELRAGSQVELLISDGVVEEFGVPAPTTKARAAKAKAAAKSGDGKAMSAAAELPGAAEALAARLREWRAVEAKRLRVPAYVVLHDKTLKALAQVRPGNPRELLAVDGMGPAKVEKFGEAILGLCGAAGRVG